ncbi:putative cell wall binding repeat 2-containing protein [Kineococcus radiotolerans SRS30216 = ATCC BAA-149]|uniref:Cell wall binding repeat 2-containing protein n=1 Tax=Kineococcus radiotolerans (strain ATCC BAA-149 / DSM 14245 / SRS30216) TaxID=266940 RepID=A6WA78_KINRD|nr:putative cell wall binding repeat 2-containing protein [Kineococcus radiotolerans SRS30216 = ATCC BAA-149]
MHISNTGHRRLHNTGHSRLRRALVVAAAAGLAAPVLTPVAGASTAAAAWSPAPAQLEVLAGTGNPTTGLDHGSFRLTRNLTGPVAVAVEDAPGTNGGRFAFVDGGLTSTVEWQDVSGLQSQNFSVDFGAWRQVFPDGQVPATGKPFSPTALALAYTQRTSDGFTVYASDPAAGYVLGGNDGSSFVAGNGGSGVPVPGPAAASPLHATALATDSHGILYATDSTADSLVAIDPVTKLLRLVAGTGKPTALADPRALAVGADDTLYVLDGNAVVHLGVDGSRTVLAGAGSEHPLAAPSALTVGDDGTLYVADGHTVSARSAGGAWSLIAGGTHGRPVLGDAVDSPLGAVTGLAVRDDGTVAIADREARQVLLVTPDQPTYGIPLEAGVHRLAGADRVQTAVLASQRLAPFAHTAAAVVIARADTYADSLAGARLASTLSAPLFLTSGDHLTPQLRAELDRVLVRSPRVYLLGTSDAVPSTIGQDIYALRPFMNADRVAGFDRFGTAVHIAERVRSWDGADDTTPLFLVNGWNYPDGLAVSALAARTGGQVLLTDGEHLPADTARYLAEYDPTGARTVPVGGVAAEAVENDIPDAAYDNALDNAIVGADRYETSALLASAFAPATSSPASDSAGDSDGDSVTDTPVGLATGENWPDALVGAAAMGILDGPLVLTPTAHLAPATADVLDLLSTTPGRISTLVVFGGTNRVFEAAQREAAAYIS